MSPREKKHYYRWCPGDLRRDTAVQACPWDVRAIWREMLDLMHDGEPRGHLTAGGVPIRTGKELSIAIGGGVPAKVCQRAIEMLGDRKVFSVTDEGVIFSRRMVRDEAIDEARAEGGEKGGRKGGDKVPPSPSSPPHPPNNLNPGNGNGTGTAREAFAGKRLKVPKFLDVEFTDRLNGQYFDLTAFYLALDARLVETGEPWDLRWIRDQFAAQSPAPERRRRPREDFPITTDERRKAEGVRRSWGRCMHEPACGTPGGCIALIVKGWRDQENAALRGDLDVVQNDEDWFDVCQRLHGGNCGGRLKHSHRMQVDAAKATA